ALVIVGTILSAIVFTAPAGAVLLQAANLVNRAEVQSRNVIDQTLKALSKVQVGVKWVVPPASIVGARQVGQRYRPVVDESLAVGVAVTSGLPVDEGSTSKLCGKAGAAMMDLVAYMLGGQSGAGKVADYAESIVSKGEAFFCGLGGGSPPDLSSVFESGAETACDDKLDELRETRNEKRSAYLGACQTYNAPCRGGPGPFNTNLGEAEQADLDQKRAEHNSAQSEVDSF